MSIDEKAFQFAVEILGKHDSHYSEWSLDEGHLRSFITDYESAKASEQPVELSIDPRNDRICHYERILNAFVNVQGYCNIRGAAEKIVDIEERTIASAISNAAEILANFKGEPDATKLEQWQACYAKLFTQMNDLVNAPKRESAQPVECAVAFEEWAERELLCIRTTLEYPGNPRYAPNHGAWGAFQAGWEARQPKRESAQPDECIAAFKAWQNTHMVPAIREGYYETYLLDAWKTAWHHKREYTQSGECADCKKYEPQLQEALTRASKAEAELLKLWISTKRESNDELRFSEQILAGLRFIGVKVEFPPHCPGEVRLSVGVRHTQLKMPEQGRRGSDE